MRSQIEVRRATDADLAALVRFQLEMADETEGLRLDPKTVERGIRAALEDSRRAEYWVAEQGVAEQSDQIIGCLMTTPEWSDWRNGWIRWIQSVYVVPTARGLGVYRRLYETIRQQVEADPETHGIRLYVDRRNEGARKAYAALGMSAEHYELFEWLAPVPKTPAGGGSTED